VTKRWLALALLVAATVSAQPSPRRATNLTAILAHPTFYHQRPIVVVGEVKLQDDGKLKITSDGASMLVVYKGVAPDAVDEVRGEFWDVGRMHSDDPRFAGYDLKRVFNVDPEGTWPRPGQVTALVASTITYATPAAAPSVRNIVLYPSRYLDQTVTVVGQFGGRNLLGDLPDAPAVSRYDFVLRSADAALWVTNLRPRGKDFELALDARIDTGRWLEVTGKLQQSRGLLWLDGTGTTVKLTAAPKEVPDTTPIRVEAAPPPEVIFSTPVPDETDVQLSSNIRIQFSRDIDAATLRNRVSVKYSEAETRERGEPATPSVEFTTQYSPGTRVLELKLKEPLERFRTVTVHLDDGILGTDKQPLAPWTLTFQTGP
jgi:hypothetical protein